jgi:hypothetical protein
MLINEDELDTRLATIEAQLRKLWRTVGLPSWEKQEKQRIDNLRSQGTKLPFSPNQAFGEQHRPKDHESK